ncbi:segregation/condensation protein A [Jeotgalibaca caeni]|uniref:segregation/condensation protein A n=1 Tax=Jeotgalibaca caeni TaxID=3028623 RepID=UPI00237EAD1C|nr:segregation/condensation protein A [Jeotgalibaca caeni]MDE1549376.1 segregation/condensation protein A [Jeotgalibaca caeni]
MMKEPITLTLHLDAFEGPLDLLLHLIKELKVDIFDIPMTEITEQYLHHLRTMQELQLDVAGEYLLMAATLLEIKSRMLLPKKELTMEEDFYEEGEDPRDELVNQLLEYKRIQEAAKLLKEMEHERGDFFTKLPADLEEFRQSIPLTPGEVSTSDLLVALQKMYQRMQRKKPLQARLDQEEVSVEKTMETILHRFRQFRHQPMTKIPFTDFFEVATRIQIVNTFLAMLELVKERQIRFIQETVYGEILLERLAGDE